MNARTFARLAAISVVVAAMVAAWRFVIGCGGEYTATCECMVSNSRARQSEFGNYRPACMTTRWLIEYGEQGKFRESVLERCLGTGLGDDAGAINEALASLCFASCPETDGICRLVIVAKSRSKAAAVAVANTCAVMMKEKMDAEFSALVDKATVNIKSLISKCEREMQALEARQASIDKRNGPDVADLQNAMDLAREKQMELADLLKRERESLEADKDSLQIVKPAK